MNKDCQILEPEVFFGLVGATGTDSDAVSIALKQALTSVNYSCETVRLSKLMHNVKHLEKFNLPKQQYEEDRINSHMNAGDEWRELTGRGDALVLLAMAEIQQKRVEFHGAQMDEPARVPVPRRAYLFRSLKHPEEVRTLREVYGASFLLISAYCPRESRLKRLADRIARSHNSMQVDEYREQAEQLINRDQCEPENPQYGQNLRGVFPLADVFVDASQVDQLNSSLNRFVELVFGHPFHTPTRDEHGMFHAQAAALRSADLSRQVGAAICTEDGSLLAVGTNDAPKAGGGLYWPGNSRDYRDFKLGEDTSTQSKKTMLMEILEELRKHDWLSVKRKDLSLDELYREAYQFLSSTQLMNVGEYGRSVHAEMAALTDAARRGIAVENATLYATTFPCHNCAKHIVASGFRRVVYIEPYPKSQAAQLYEDSIVVDSPEDIPHRVRFQPFVGVAPRFYMSAFQMGTRWGPDHKPITWDNTHALPRVGLSRYSASYVDREDWLLRASEEQLEESNSASDSA